MRPTVKLGEICQIRTGKKDANYGTDDGQYAFFTCGKEILKAPDYSFDTEAILIAGNGDVGDCKYYKGEFEAYQRTYVLDDFDEKIDIHYAFHLLSGKLKGHVLKQIKGSAIPYIKLGALQNFEIPLPPLETQKAIVAKLDQIFAELDQTKSEIQKNLDNADELWKSSLNQAFQGDWEMKKLDDMVEFSQGIQVPIGEQYLEKKEGLVRFLRIIDFTQGGQEPRYVEDFGDRYRVNSEDLSMVRYGATTGFICSGMEGIIANNLFKITPKKENITKKYLYIYFKSPEFEKFLQKEVFGAAMPAISFGTLKSLKIPVPPLSEQEKIVEHLDQVSKEVKELKSKYQSQLDNLEELKKSVLDKAFKGELVE